MKCSECGKPGATERHKDAGGVSLNMHGSCWLSLQWWLSGFDGPRPAGKCARWDEKMGRYVAVRCAEPKS